MRWYRALVVLTTVGLAACSSGGGPPRPALIEAWRASTITPIGQPEAAGDTVVVYGTEDQDLFLYGFSAADGSLRWRRPASPSLTLPGIAMTPRVVDGRVVYFRPDPKANLAARLVVAAPDTGDDLLVSDSMVFGSFPARCADGKDICVSIATDSGSDPFLRFSVEARGTVPDRNPLPAGSRKLGEGMLDLGQRRPEILAGFEDGAVRWRSPITNYFSPGYSSDLGWHFERYRSAGVHVGTVGSAAAQNDAVAVVRDLGKVQTAAIVAGTGASAWRADGTSFACESTIAVYHAVDDGRSELWPVRCRYQGRSRYDRASGTTTYEGLGVTLEGFDVGTGATTWSVPLGAAEAFMDNEIEAARASETEVVIQAAAGPVVVDLATGTSRPPGKGETFWCAAKVFFDYREPRPRTGTDRRGGTRLSPCAGDRSPTSSLPRYLARSKGATVGERTVIATAQGLVAYDRAPAQ